MSDATGIVDVPYHTSPEDKTNEPDVRNILGVDVCVLDRNDAFSLIDTAVREKRHQKLAFLNAHGGNLASQNAAYRKTLKSFKVLSDGIGVDVGSSILYSSKFPANLNGTDFVPKMFENLTGSCKVGLLGAEPGIAERAAAVFSRNHPRHEFIVISDGYFTANEQQDVLGRLSEIEPDILLVALGNPQQETWIANHCNASNVTVPIGVGALLDFVAGKVMRAPDWMIKARIEWVYRLWLEPSRMWRRYVLGNPVFILRILRQKFFGLTREQKS